MAVYNRKTR